MTAHDPVGSSTFALLAGWSTPKEPAVCYERGPADPTLAKGAARGSIRASASHVPSRTSTYRVNILLSKCICGPLAALPPRRLLLMHAWSRRRRRRRGRGRGRGRGPLVSGLPAFCFGSLLVVVGTMKGKEGMVGCVCFTLYSRRQFTIKSME
jgi:hypothetical protein